MKISYTPIRSLAVLLSLLSFYGHSQTIYSGVATYFDDLGKPYGGCGVPENLLETSHYVALNVFDTPGSGTQYVRPIKGNDLAVMGEFQNGNNCGRWVKVTILENCQGTNDGALNLPLCRGTNASWVTDKFYGAQLDMIVTDACGDGNGWCRDHPFHLDLHTSSLDKFELNGQTTSGMYPTYFNNRKIKWEYIEAPNYTGDVRIYMMQAAQQYYSPILITHLPNGIHKVEQKVGNTWLNVPRNSDLGQSFVLPNNTPPYTIRITDANDKLLHNGREYTFPFPSSCGSTCTLPATEVAYTTYEPVVLDLVEPDLRNKKGFQILSSGSNVRILIDPNFAGPFKIRVFNSLGQEMNSNLTRLKEGTYSLGSYPNGIYKLAFYLNHTLSSTASFCVFD